MSKDFIIKNSSKIIGPNDFIVHYTLTNCNILTTSPKSHRTRLTFDKYSFEILLLLC